MVHSGKEHGIANTFNYVVRTPRPFYFDESNNTQVQECLPAGMDLKTYALKRYASPTPAAMKPQCLQLGTSLGQWLRGLHDYTGQDPRPAFEAEIAKNVEMQKLKQIINYDWLVQRVDQFADVLSEPRELFEKVREMAAAEMRDVKQLRVIHGDFWSGK